MKNNQQNLYQKTSHQKSLHRYLALQETIEKRLISIKPHSPHASTSPEKSLLFCTPLDPLSKPCSLSFFSVMKNNQHHQTQANHQPHQQTLSFCTPLSPLLKAMLSVILHRNEKQSTPPDTSQPSTSPEKSLLFCIPLDPLSKPCSLSFFSVMKNNQQNLYQKTSHQKPLYRYSALQEQQPKAPHRYQVSPASHSPASNLPGKPLLPLLQTFCSTKLFLKLIPHPPLSTQSVPSAMN